MAAAEAPVMKRAVVYARYSSDRQSDGSTRIRCAFAVERSEADGHILIQVYSDHAISGATLCAQAFKR